MIFAALSIEMALSRGGDQAVIKDRYDFTFFGGRTKQTERRTKVKSRVMASSLSELITQSSRVFIMGHKMADLDALGAAAGVACLCRKKGQEGQHRHGPGRQRLAASCWHSCSRLRSITTFS